MTEEQSSATGAGRPALNIERIYSTTVPVEELARTLADHFRAQEFEAQVYRTSGDRTVMQARKESLWRQLLGGELRVDSGLRSRRGPGEHQSRGSRVGRCGSERGDRAGGGTAGAARHRLRHLEGEPVRQGGLAGDRQSGQRQLA
jgi:hypothetical protein